MFGIGIGWHWNHWWHIEVSIGQKVDDIPHPSVRFEGGACVMTEVGEGMVG